MAGFASEQLSLEGYYGVAPEFTAVLFKPGDNIGLACALLSLVPPAILMMHLATFLARRTAQDLWFAGGQVVCEALNFVIKRIIGQERPKTPVLNLPTESFGMPSAHSQFMGFVLGYIATQMAMSPHIPSPERALRVLGVALLAGAVGFARYYLYYHSAVQVLAGIFFGQALGTVWYLLSIGLRRLGVVQWGLSLWPCRLLLVKDVDYDLRKEYKAYRASLEKKKV